jgi:hypothetical protein
MTKITTVLQQIQSRLVAPKEPAEHVRELQLPKLRGHPERTETAAGRTEVQLSRCPMIWSRSAGAYTLKRRQADLCG